MDLWIRSQDREDLVKVNALWLMDNQIWMEVPFYENHKKIGLTVSGHNHKLAEYKTKERALEVLDEIQEYINNECKKYVSNGDSYTASYKYSVYEMPKG